MVICHDIQHIVACLRHGDTRQCNSKCQDVFLHILRIKVTSFAGDARNSHRARQQVRRLFAESRLKICRNTHQAKEEIRQKPRHFPRQGAYITHRARKEIPRTRFAAVRVSRGGAGRFHSKSPHFVTAFAGSHQPFRPFCGQENRPFLRQNTAFQALVFGRFDRENRHKNGQKIQMAEPTLGHRFSYSSGNFPAVFTPFSPSGTRLFHCRQRYPLPVCQRKSGNGSAKVFKIRCTPMQEHSIRKFRKITIFSKNAK